MAYILNGNIIEQSGTNTSLAGLELITGVNSLSHTNNGLEYTVYDLGTLRLNISGIQTILPDIEMILSNCGVDNVNLAVNVLDGGVLNIGRKLTENGNDTFSSGTAIINTEHNAYYGKGRSVTAQSGGTINWYGGELKLGNGIECELG